ncbi:MAG: hypothetical protein JO314_02645, partial [Acidobacteria bacterium]|nr:hypothetical protein [Acidobacteriota bacterium]
IKEEKAPEIYTDRSSGGYDFFPNCTKNAFETAASTLDERISSHGPSDPNVVNWVKAQDDVFANCVSGRQAPEDPPAGAPTWLQKDRAYQKAAAEFYSMNYDAARQHFAEIGLDTESPWQETANYMVIRTLIRQASLTKDHAKSDGIYDDAERRLQSFVSGTGKFSSSAERLTGLIAYRRHPKERVSELAKKIAFFSGNENFRQDVIDYCWLLDKFEANILTEEEQKKAAEEAKKNPANANGGAEYAERLANSNASTSAANTAANTESQYKYITGKKKSDEDLEINLYIDNSGSYTAYVAPEATDAEAIAEVEKLVGRPLTEEQKNQVKSTRRSAYAACFSTNSGSSYEGGYYGQEKLRPALLAGFLRQDDITDWLFAYQMAPTPEAYLYALNKYKAAPSELWLMTALSKADQTSTYLPRLFEAADHVSHDSPAWPTIAYHTSRLLIDQGKMDDARRIVDGMLEMGERIPISTRNTFLQLKVKFTQTLEEFLTYSLRRPYAFDFGGEVGRIDDMIAEQKKQYDPEYNKDGREAYEKEIEENYKVEKLWQDRAMFDTDTIEVFNQHFPIPQLIEVERSPALPDYLRERFAMAIWMRSFLLDDLANLLKITPEVIKYHPDFADDLQPLLSAKTLSSQDHAILFFVLKHPILTPYIEDGMGRTSDEQDPMASDNWWCAPYDQEYDEATGAERPKAPPHRPAFLTAVQSRQAQTDRKRLKEIGDSPKYLAEKVMDWAKRFPTDRRVPEALYVVISANGWTKYGCGNNEDITTEYSTYLRKHYPDSEWVRKLDEDQKEK